MYAHSSRHTRVYNRAPLYASDLPEHKNDLKFNFCSLSCYKIISYPNATLKLQNLKPIDTPPNVIER